MTRKPTREFGFSLPEIIVVVAIAATLATVAIIKMTTSTRNVRLRAAAKKLQADIEYAQELAMNLGREVQVWFDLAGNSYRLTWSDGSPINTPAGARPYIVQLGAGNYRSVQLTGSDLPGYVLRFRPDGKPYHGSGPLTRSRVVARLGDRYELVIEPRTGNLRIRNVGEE